MLLPDVGILSGELLHPLKDIREGEKITGGCGWGETAVTRVSDIFVQFDHKGPVLTLKTSRGAEVRVSPEHPCFCRLNPLGRHYYLYLMERSTVGFRVGMSQELIKELVAMQTARPDWGNHQEIVDRLWIIESTENLPKAIFLQKYVETKYGLPGFPFSAKHAVCELTDDLILELFNRIDTPSRARQLLLDSMMFEDSPHVTFRYSRSNPAVSSAIQFVMFGSSERSGKNNWFSHLIRIDGTVELKGAEGKQFKRRVNKAGLWNMEVSREDLEEAQLFVKTLACLDTLEIVKKIQLSRKNPYYLMPASHVKVGMSVPVLDRQGIDDDIVVSVQSDTYQGPLYDLRIDGLNNYIAGGWVVGSYSGPGKQPPIRDVS